MTLTYMASQYFLLIHHSHNHHVVKVITNHETNISGNCVLSSVLNMLPNHPSCIRQEVCCQPSWKTPMHKILVIKVKTNHENKHNWKLCIEQFAKHACVLRLCRTFSCIACAHLPLWGDNKVILLTGTYTHKLLRKLQMAIYNHQADFAIYFHFFYNVWFGDLHCLEYGSMWHQMSLLRPDVIKPHTTRT